MNLIKLAALTLISICGFVIPALAWDANCEGKATRYVKETYGYDLKVGGIFVELGQPIVWFSSRHSCYVVVIFEDASCRRVVSSTNRCFP